MAIPFKMLRDYPTRKYKHFTPPKSRSNILPVSVGKGFGNVGITFG